MSDKVGPISYSSEKEIFIGRDMASHVTYSEETAGIIDEEVQKIIISSLEKARKILGENRAVLDNMARLLVERETIFTEEVDMLMEGKSVEEIIAFMDENEKTLSENPFARKSGKDKVSEPKANKETEVVEGKKETETSSEGEKNSKTKKGQKEDQE
ncbi:MAG: hypothetical protein IKA99_07875 [Clostridia bacterium]|nr:hypothetical protein [Clostridia bacterium]